MGEQLSQNHFRFAAVLALIIALGCSGSQEIIESPDTQVTNSDLGGQASGGSDTGSGDDTSIVGCSLALDCMHLLIATTCKRPLCSNGICALNNAANGQPCKDSDSCFVGKTCQDGDCLGGTPKYCDDQNPCTSDSCSSESGCIYSAIAGSCDDGNPCTLADHCNDGKCISGNSVCPCTSDSMCAEWNDNNLCNGVVRCMGGVCKIDPTTVVQCLESENDDCSKLGCNPATGECGVVNAPEGTTCDDGVLCTTPDSCSGGICISGPGSCACVQDNDCLALDDGDLCNGLLHCVGGQCIENMNSQVSCPQAADPCSPGGCNPATGQCGSTALADGTACDDGNQCTQGDSCQSGFCTGTGIICDDGNLCTDDLCDGAGKCAFIPNAAGCDDGNQCTQSDLCSNGLCQGTNDTCSCNSQADCDIMPNDACLGSLICINNICTADPTTAIFCDPSGNSDCMANECVGGQCMMQPINNGAACFSGTPCIDGAICTGGKCQPLGESTCACKGGNPLVCGTTKPWSNEAFGSTDNIDAWSCGVGDFSGREYAFTYSTNTAKSVTVSLKKEQANTQLFLVEDLGNGCLGSSCIKTHTSKMTFLAAPFKNYYVVVDGKEGANGKFDIKVECKTQVESDCADLADNDADGLIDCADDDCADTLFCTGEKCNDGFDDDGDGLIDCADPDCAAKEDCETACTASAKAYCGLSTFWKTDGYGSTNNVSGYLCASATFDGPEFVYKYEPTSSSMVTVELQQAFDGHGIFVMQDQGGGCNANSCVAYGTFSTVFYAVSGVTYYIAIDGMAATKGSFHISVKCD